MSNEANEAGKATATWSTARTFTLAIVCLAIGTLAGYFVRGSSPAQSAVTQAAATAPQKGPSAHAGGMPSEEQMRHMADKQAEPLLAQLEKNPNDAQLLAKIGRTYMLARQFDTAAEYYDRSAKAKPDADTLTTLGGIYHYAGQNEKAIATWKRALEVDPKHADAMVNIGLIEWREQSDPDAAIAIWKQMLKTNPKHPQRASVEKLIAQAQKHKGMTAPPQIN
jgi:cytochrome c-type biogenesis protein CcmH/NrfG